MSQLTAAEPFPSPGRMPDSPELGEWQHAMSPEASNALLASRAQYEAEFASKCAAEMAAYFQSLWVTVHQLQCKVTELEEWKKKALEDVRKLRDEHKVLRRKVYGDEPETRLERTSARAKTLPASQLLITDTPPPGLQLPPKQDSLGAVSLHAPSLSSGVSTYSNMTSASIVSDDGGHLEGVQLSNVSVDGLDLERAEWRIGQLSQKLKGCMGRALVSPPFNAAGLEELRLMVFPEGKESTKGPRSKRQRELYNKKVNEGPLEGCLKLKVPICPNELELQYFLKVGNSRKGPFKRNFAESTVSGCDNFDVDWLTQLAPDSSLTVCVEFVKD
mmetsp:Transcript_36752/g.84847  ORF Transcript_36752/g.84847 Transcript_36752/m.84847 type:complete len:331 (-) Transcript_36752:170-1162(-)